MLVDIGAHFFAAAGRLTYEEGRPVRRASRIPPDVLTRALGAVSDLALALSPEEAAAANATACCAVLPLLRGSEDPGRVAAVKEGIKALHAAAVTGQPPPDGVQQQLEAALRDMSSSTGKRKVPEGNNTSSKQQRVLGAEQPISIDELPCQICGIPEGSSMLVCDWCGSGAGHLRCLGLADVPDGVWCCSSMCEEHSEEAQAAADLHSRWVVGRFPGITGGFWGQLSYVSFGLLQLRYSDGELYEGVWVAHVLGGELLVGHSNLELQPVGCVVPAAVLRRCGTKGWLVTG